ncbi:hypothetical protein LshimejAT787_1200860 [Lyophyllum shimeji]|uniref:Uncharacterized protein n=1 Tax=Lyophyllum shimeji TaxID=47721 RepID=A0A9P3PTM6_LYOSH|nr:hypothetical protein LshimejAT787_1200860 [Lyophyllum shimeji]
MDYVARLKHRFHTLTSLTILDARLSLTEVTSLLNALATPSLKCLSLSVTIVSLELFDLLASTLPALNRLILDTGSISFVGRYGVPSDIDRFSASLRDHRDAHKNLYDSWQLSHLEVWMWEYGVGRRLQSEALFRMLRQ